MRFASAATALVLVALVGVGHRHPGGADPGADRAGARPVSSLADGVTVGRSTAPVTLDLYEDPQCPVCAQFESQVGPAISGWIASGKVKVHYHVISFLDSASTTKYSSRAANALYAAAGVSPDAFAKYHQLLYQPAAGRRGRPG